MIIAHIHSHLSSSLWEGLMHPLTGWDHLLMLVSIGFLSTHFINHQKRILITILLGLLVGGGLRSIAQSGVIVEIFIGATLALCGYYLIKRTSVVNAFEIVVLVGGIGIIHGMAHGMELKGSNPFSFFGGMLMMSFFISSGVSIFLLFLKRDRSSVFISVGVLSVLGGCIKLIG